MDPRNGMGSKSRSSNIWAGDSWVLSKSPISPLNIHIFGLVNLPCFPSNLGFRVPNFPRHPMNMPINTAWVLYKNSLYKNLRARIQGGLHIFSFFCSVTMIPIPISYHITSYHIAMTSSFPSSIIHHHPLHLQPSQLGGDHHHPAPSALPARYRAEHLAVPVHLGRQANRLPCRGDFVLQQLSQHLLQVAQQDAQMPNAQHNGDTRRYQ